MDIPALLHRMKEWNRSPVVYADRRVYGCEICNDRKKETELRETSVGEVCIECFLSLPPCSSCGLEIAIQGYGYRRLCQKCLNPEPTPLERELELLHATRRHDSVYDLQIERLVWAESIEIK